MWEWSAHPVIFWALAYFGFHDLDLSVGCFSYISEFNVLSELSLWLLFVARGLRTRKKTGVNVCGVVGVGRWAVR